MSDSVQPQRQQPPRLPCPWDSPGKNTGVGCHFLLQCMKMKSESEDTQSCPTLSDPMDCSLPGSSIHGIFQARVLEWGAIAFSGRSCYSLRIFFSNSPITMQPLTTAQMISPYCWHSKGYEKRQFLLLSSTYSLGGHGHNIRLTYINETITEQPRQCINLKYCTTK